MAIKKRVIKQDKKDKQNCECKTWKCNCGGFFYFLGFIGASIHYISQATGFWMGVVAFLKAIVWPVFVVMKILGL